MLHLELESALTRTPPNPPGPSGFQSFLRIARRGVPFTSIDGRAFMTVPAQSSGYRTLPIRSRAFRQWFFDQSLSEFETIPTARAFSAILCYLEAQAVRRSSCRLTRDSENGPSANRITLAGATFLRSSAQIRLRESCGPRPCVIIADTWDSFTLGAGLSIR